MINIIKFNFQNNIGDINYYIYHGNKYRINSYLTTFKLNTQNNYIKQGALNNSYFKMHVDVKKKILNIVLHKKEKLYHKYYYNNIAIKFSTCNELLSKKLYHGYKIFLCPSLSNYNLKRITDAIVIKSGNIFSYKDIFLIKKNFFYIKNFLIKEFKIQRALTNTINIKKKLNIDIVLTPLKKYETQIYFETTFYKIFHISPGITFLIRNIFKKGENFNFSLKKNISFMKNKIINSFNNYNIQANLYFPYFHFPFKWVSIKKYNPRSNINIQFYIAGNKKIRNIIGMNSLEYFWDTNDYSTHKINILYNIIKKIISYKDILLLNKSYPPYFELQKKYFIYSNSNSKNIQNIIFMNKKSIDKNYLINSISYIYNYNQIIDKKNKRPTVFSVKIEMYSNIFSLLKKFFYKNYKFNYYNFFQFNLEYKKYFIITNNKLFISHFLFGITFPYNSYNKLPLNKKYFCDINNDIRAWYTYSLGPGNMKKKSIYSSFSDIKIIFNIEYRLKIISDTYLTFFADAGNLWIIKSHIHDKRGIFYFNNFYKQFALGCGLGLRYNLKYIIARIDLSHKIIDPTKNFWNKSILHNNIINFSIGYPF